MKLYLFIGVFLLSQTLVAQVDLFLADSLYDKAVEMNREIRYERALVYAVQAQAIYLKLEKWDKYYLTRQMELSFVTDLDDYDRAWAIYNTLVNEIPVKLGANHSQEGMAHVNAGILVTDQDQDYERAYDYFNKGIEILLDQETLDVSALNIAYGEMSFNRSALGLMDEGIEYSQKAIDLIHQNVDTSFSKDEHLCFHYRVVGDCYMDKGAFQKAYEYHNKALILYEKVFGKTHLRTGIIYHSLADISRELDQPQNAIAYNKKALNIFLENVGEEHLYVALTYNNLGNVFLLQKDYEKAVVFFEKAIRIARLLGNDGLDYLAIAYVNLGVANNELENYKKAEYYIQEALKMDQEVFGNHNTEVAEDYNYLTMCYRDQGKWEEALAANLAAILANSIDYKSTDPYLFKKALKEADFFMNPYITVEIFTTKGELLLAIYNETKDVKTLKKAFEGMMELVAYIDKIKQQFFIREDEIDFSKRANSVYELGIIIAEKLYEETKDKACLRSAFVLAEKNKSAALAKVLQMNSAIKVGQVSDSLQEQEKALKEQIAEVEYFLVEAQVAKNKEQIKELRLELFELKRSLEVLVKKLEQEYPAYYELKYATDWMEAAEVQEKILGTNEMLLEYFVGDSTVYLFAVTPNNIDFYKLCQKKEMRKLVDQLRKNLTNLKQLSQKPREAYDQFGYYAHEFYKKLLEPAIKDQEMNRLIIVPDDFLNFIPFEIALTKASVQSAKQQIYKELDYLLFDHEINYSYSARLLRKETLEKAKLKQEVLGFAASYEQSGIAKRSTLNPLPSVMGEIKGLESKFEGHYLYGNKATEEVFKEKVADYSIIHLAMHGLLNSKYPELSCLAFSLGSDSLQYDDFLYAYEISNLSIDADLVVLSACETGYGKFEGGEGVMSLARSFMYAGVPSLVVSLWQVNDNATAIIMKLFYNYIAEGKTKATALHAAKKDYLTLKSTGVAAHPNFWAAFIHLGQDGTILLQSKKKTNLLLWYSIIGGIFLLSIFFFIKRTKRNKWKE